MYSIHTRIHSHAYIQNHTYIHSFIQPSEFDSDVALNDNVGDGICDAGDSGEDDSNENDDGAKWNAMISASERILQTFIMVALRASAPGAGHVATPPEPGPPNQQGVHADTSVRCRD